MVTITKANALAGIEGNKVWIVVTDNKRESIAPISDKVHVISLNVNYYEDDWKGWYCRMKGNIVKGRMHKREMRDLLNTIMPDIVISTGTSEKFFLPYLNVKSNPKYIREFHFDKWVRDRAAISLATKGVAKMTDWYEYGWKIKKYDKIVVLTNEDRQENWKGWDNVVVIPNPMTRKHAYHSLLNNKIAIAVGRFVRQKNFASLVRIWSSVVKRDPDWKLQIWGDGDQKNILKEQIVSAGLQENVLLMGYSHNVLAEMEKASIFVLSSIYEGFGLVIVEAMSVGLPVVSYMCPCGPKDNIKEGKDGFLIPVGDETLFAERICELIGDEEKRKKMGENAEVKSKSFSIERIIGMWMTLFSEIQENQNIHKL